MDFTMEVDADYIICRQKLWDTEGSFLLELDLVAPTDGDDAFDVVLLKESSGSFSEKFRVRFTTDAPMTNWVIGLKPVSGAWYYDDVELIAGCGTYQEPYMADRRFYISSDREIIRVGGKTPEYPHYEFWKCHEADWDYVAIGHGGGPRSVRFDRFRLEDHWVHNRACPFWGCVCGGTPLGGGV